MAMLLNFPLLLISLAIYNFIAFFTTAISWSDQVVSLPVQSGVDWAPTVGDCLIAFSLFLLFLELLKVTRTSVIARFDHVFSVIVFVGAMVEFLLVPQATNSVFAILVLLMLIDALGGWTIAIRIAAGQRMAEITPPLVPVAENAPISPTPASDPASDPEGPPDPPNNPQLKNMERVGN